MEKLTDTKIVHFGSVSMTMEPSRSTTFTAIQRAKAAGAKISFDPNLRQMMWDNLQDAKEQILRGIAFSDYVKLSEEELIFLTDGNNLEQRMLSLLHDNKMSFLIVTLGSQGCLCLYKENFYRSYAYNVPCVDTTGAGDAFWGMALHKILKHNSDEWKQDEILNLLRFANAAGSLTTVRKGAISAIPTMEEKDGQKDRLTSTEQHLQRVKIKKPTGQELLSCFIGFIYFSCPNFKSNVQYW
jgi:sugar/nucleoside kinase (ribokinase family)